MAAPDRIWRPTARGVDVQYLRATPELLALIEAAKAFAMAMPRKYQGISEAALAFAKSQDHPDAG